MALALRSLRRSLALFERRAIGLDFIGQILIDNQLFREIQRLRGCIRIAFIIPGVYGNAAKHDGNSIYKLVDRMSNFRKGSTNLNKV